MIKKYRLIPEKEYDLLKKGIETTALAQEPQNNLLESKLPDDVKIKLFQDQKRIECNERERAEIAAKHGPPITVKKDVEVQHDQEPTPRKECGTSPMQDTNGEESEDRDNSPRKRKIPQPKNPRLQDFQKESMRRIARFLATIGIVGNTQGNIFINQQLVPESDYVGTIRQLADARVKRTPATNIVVNELKKHVIPDNIFSSRIMNEIGKPSVSNVDTKSINWSSF